MAEEQPQTKADDVVKEILEMAGYETEGDDGYSSLTELPIPIVSAFCWFGQEGKKATLFELGQPIPLGPKWSGLTIFSVFADDDEVRVYAVAVAGAKGGQPLPPHRFSLSKTHPVFLAEMMDLDVFKVEISEELKAIDDGSAIELEDPDDKKEPDAANGQVETAPSAE